MDFHSDAARAGTGAVLAVGERRPRVPCRYTLHLKRGRASSGSAGRLSFDGLDKILPGPQIELGRLHRSVAEKK